jgi:hypothetical protein
LSMLLCMTHIHVTSAHIEQALINAEKIPQNIRNSIRKGKGRGIGCLGEIILAEFLGVPVSNTFNHDLIFKDCKIEVKSKERTVSPESHFNASVANFNPHQKCDFYAFLSITQRHRQPFNEIKDAYIMGVISKARFFEEATFYKKGELDPLSPGGLWAFRADCYNVPYSTLLPPPACVAEPV